MKYFFNFKIYLLLIPIFICCNCTHKKQYSYGEKQSDLILKLRKQKLYEYSSPFNKEMKKFLQHGLKLPDTKLPMSEVWEVEEKIKYDKPLLGCYYFESVIQENKKLWITLEWNSNAGVIIRIFTDSGAIINQLQQLYFKPKKSAAPEHVYPKKAW